MLPTVDSLRNFLLTATPEVRCFFQQLRERPNLLLMQVAP